MRILFGLLFLFSFSLLAQENVSDKVKIKLPSGSCDCQFSHFSVSSYGPKTKLRVYTCTSDTYKTVLIKNEEGMPGWKAYSSANGKFSIGAPLEVTNSQGEVLSAVSEIGFHRRGGLAKEKDDLSLSFMNGTFILDELAPISGTPSEDFTRLKSDIGILARERLSFFKDLSTNLSTVEVEDENGKKMKCKRFMNSPGKSCHFYSCGENSILHFDPDDMNSPYVINLKSTGGESLGVPKIIFNQGDEWKSSNIKTPDPEVSFYNIMKSAYSFYNNKKESCKDPNFDLFSIAQDQALTKTLQRLDQLPYHVLIKNIDGILSTVTTAGPTPTNMCAYQDIYFDEEAVGLEEVKNLIENQSKHQTYNLADAKKIFDFFKNQADIPWEYARDGCYARAHLAALRAEKELGIDLDKVWLFGENLSPKTDPSIHWSYHVAATINVEDSEGNITLMVLDPALSDRPLTVKEWSRIFSPSQEMPLRGGYNTFLSKVPLRPTYTITGNEVYNIRELTTGNPLSPEEKVKQSEEHLKKFSEILQNGSKQ